MGILGNVKLAQWDGRGEDGSPHAETFEQLPKRIQIVVWDDFCHS